MEPCECGNVCWPEVRCSCCATVVCENCAFKYEADDDPEDIEHFCIECDLALTENGDLESTDG